MTDAFSALENEPRWLVWREERRGPQAKPTKVPYCARGGPGKSDDPATWAERVTAQEYARHFLSGSAAGGVGIVLGDLGADLHLAGIDLDSCLDDGVPADWAAEVLGIARTYCELSPSGRGVKSYFYIASKDVRQFLDRIGVDRNSWGTRRGIGPNSGDHGPAIEIYCALRYFAVTGHHWAQSPPTIQTLDRNALDALAALIPPPAARTNRASGADNSRSAKAWRKGAELRRQGCTFDEMCEALANDPDPEIRDWVAEKGEAAGGRELQRIWDRTGQGWVHALAQIHVRPGA